MTPLCLGVLAATYNDAAEASMHFFIWLLHIQSLTCCVLRNLSYRGQPLPLRCLLFIMHVTATKQNKTTVILPDLFKGFVVQSPRVNKDYSTVKPISEQWLAEYVVLPSIMRLYWPRVENVNSHLGWRRESSFAILLFSSLSPLLMRPMRSSRRCVIGEIG